MFEPDEDELSEVDVYLLQEISRMVQDGYSEQMIVEILGPRVDALRGGED